MTATPSRRRRAGPGIGTLLFVLLGIALAAYAYRRHRRHAALQEVSAAERADVAPVPRAHYGRLLEPTGNTVLHGAGQTDITSFIAYSNTVAPSRPTLFMTYVDLHDDLPAFFRKLQQDLATADNVNGSTADAVKGSTAGTPPPCAPTTALCAPSFARTSRKGWGRTATAAQRSPKVQPGPTKNRPEILPQIGLSLNHGEATKHYEADVAAGKDDTALDQLCAGLNAFHRPVFLRPGYEFNGPWNGYQPTAYIAAFRRIATRVHTCAPDTALVWDWSADAEVDTEAGGNPAPAVSRWQPFYPGDDAVDWWGLNLFTAASLRARGTEQFLQAAALARRPVMLAESAPKGFQIATSATVWPDWFAPYFALIHRHSGIQAFCYINWNWSAYPQWADWGDGRIETAPPTLQHQLRTELARPLYHPR